jgi:hypothetical protein
MQLVVVALQDTQDGVRKYWKAGGVPVAMDSGALAGRFAVSAIPTTIFIDAEGRIANVKVGFSTAADFTAYLDGIG